MFNADMARAISTSSYSKDELQDRLERTHKAIAEDAKRGYRNHLLWYTDHTETAIDKALKEALYSEGFRFTTMSEVLGGIRQHSAVYVCW